MQTASLNTEIFNALAGLELDSLHLGPMADFADEYLRLEHRAQYSGFVQALALIMPSDQLNLIVKAARDEAQRQFDEELADAAREEAELAILDEEEACWDEWVDLQAIEAGWTIDGSPREELMAFADPWHVILAIQEDWFRWVVLAELFDQW